MFDHHAFGLTGGTRGVHDINQMPGIDAGFRRILALRGNREPGSREYPCIRCGRCLEACPYFLNPSKLARLAKARLFEEMQRYSVSDCVECGSCTYSCPSGIPIVQLIRSAKSQIRQSGSSQG